ncbi:MAG: thioredoxin family protein [Bacteroidales bacterium]|nr:thioredoxin family protein [Bacteroidales bacterium]
MNISFLSGSLTGARALIGLCLLLLALSTPLLAQEAGETNYSDPETWLLGNLNYDFFLDKPHNSWFSKGFNEYSFDDSIFIELEKTRLDEVDIVVVLGTWCPDSRRELPRFMKIIESLGYDADRIRFIGVDSYKEAPVDDYDSFDIDRVPTFIFYHEKSELGRIIEYPEASLEKDMLDILRILRRIEEKHK